MSRNVRYALIILVLILAWLISGLFVSDDEPENETETTELTHVGIMSSTVAFFQPSLKFNARTEPYRLVNLRAETNGPLISTDINEGSEVIQGSVLGRIDTESRQLRVQEAQSLLQQARLDYKGALELKAKGLLSDAEIARNKFSVDSAKASLKAAELELSRVEFSAPFDGILNERFYEVGDYIQQGQIFAEFLQIDPIKAVFQVPESEVLFLDPEMPLTLVLSDGQQLKGDFLYRSAKANQTSRAFKVEAVFENPDNRILADLIGIISVELKPVKAHSVPASVLSLNTEGDLVIKTLDADQTVNSYPVEIIADSANSVWVTGLPELVDVIVTGYEYVGVGEQVRASRKQMFNEGEQAASSTSSVVQDQPVNQE